MLRLLRFFTWFAVTVFLLALTLAVTLYLGSSEKEKQVQEIWAKVAGPMETLQSDFPRTETSEAALKFERLVSELGIDIAPKMDKLATHPTDEQRKSFDEIKSDLNSYLAARIETEQHTSTQPPEKLLNYLELHHQKTEEMVQYLNTHNTLAWTIDIDQLYSAPLPNLLGHMFVQRVLLLHALTSNDAGQTQACADALESSWSLSLSLRRRPELISELIVIAIARMQQGVLRQIKAPLDNRWDQRLQQMDFSEASFRAQEREIWALLEANKRGLLEKDFGTNSILLRPVLHFLLLDYAERIGQETLALKNRDFCSPVAVPKDDGELNKIPRWNIIGRVAYVNPARAWNRVARLRIEAELTRNVFLLHNRSDEAQMGEMKSLVCPDQKWTTENLDHALQLSFSKKMDWSHAGFQNRTPILLRHSESPGDSTRRIHR